MANRYTVPNLSNAAGSSTKKKKPRRDLSKRGRELAKRKGKSTQWVGKNTTWVSGRTNKIIAPREGTREKAGQNIKNVRNRQKLMTGLTKFKKQPLKTAGKAIGKSAKWVSNWGRKKKK